MPVCFVRGCDKKYKSFDALMSHYKYWHKIKVGDTVSCNEGNCGRTYDKLISLKKHFLNKHLSTNTVADVNVIYPPVSPLVIPQVSPPASPAVITEASGSSDSGDLNLADIQETMNNIVHDEELLQLMSVDDFQNFIKWEAASLLEQLYSEDIIPRNKVQLVVDLVSNLFTSCVDFLQSNLSGLEGLQEGRMTVQNLLEPLKKPFEGLETEHKRFQHFESCETFIKPKSFLIGENTEVALEKGETIRRIVKYEGQFISLRKILKKFLSVDTVLPKILKYIEKLKDEQEIVCNFMQGEHWQNRKHNFGSKIVIPICVYSDDYETGNACGSHAGQHKLTGVYASILPMPPQFSSLLSNIFLTMLFHASDKKEFGSSAVYGILIDELNSLFSDGILFETPCFTGTIYFPCELMLGDNLDLNSKLGFVESFTASYPCRICKIHISDLIRQCNADHIILRNRENYEADLSINNSKLTGIKSECVWHRLPFFHATENVAVDSMHDLVEGVVKYDLLLIMKHLIFYKKYFTLETLNCRMKDLNFGSTCENTPPLITENELSNNTLRMSASETLTFCRFFGLIVGHCVHENDNCWELYIILRKIVDIVWSVSHQRGTEELLESYIWQHHETYLKITDSTEKFKYHVLTHYPLMMKKFGPLKNINCMRFEAKHRPSIKAARCTSSRRNICRTLAVKNQLKFHHYLRSNKVCKEQTSVGPGHKLLLSGLWYYDELKPSLPSTFSRGFAVNWAKVSGTLYKPNMVIVVGTSDFLPQFSLILSIIKFEDCSVGFVCQELATLDFNEHYFAYAVLPLDKRLYFDQKSLTNYAPTLITNDYYNHPYVTFIGAL